MLPIGVINTDWVIDNNAWRPVSITATQRAAVMEIGPDFFRRSADVRSVGYSELIVLSRDDVLTALKDHPDAEVCTIIIIIIIM